MLKQGATALPESWNASRGASHNHFMLGQVTEWFYHDLAGIRPDASAPGFKKFIVNPQPVGDLTWTEASYASIHGLISVRWERGAKVAAASNAATETAATAAKFTLKITVPANTTATVYVPLKVGADATALREGGHSLTLAATGDTDATRGVKFLRVEGDRAVLAVESGRYVFESVW